MFGNDVRILEFVENAYVDITGINNNDVPNLCIAQGTGLVETINNGMIVIIMSQYAHLGSGRTIHSKGQMESFGCLVDDKS